MKKTITTMKLSAIVGLLFFSAQSAMAVNIYVCKSGTVKLGYALSSEYELKNGDQVVWVEWDVANDINIGDPIETFTYSSSLDDVALELAGTDILDGSHNYRAQVISSVGDCTGDMSTPVEVFKLPDLLLSLGLPSLAEYCENGAVTSSEITATTSSAPTFPNEVPLVYSWTATNGGVAVTDLTSVGTSTANNTITTELTNIFTVKTTTVGTYDFSASVAYAAATTDGIAIKGGCSTTSATPATVTVTPKPGTPTITVE